MSVKLVLFSDAIHHTSRVLAGNCGMLQLFEMMLHHYNFLKKYFSVNITTDLFVISIHWLSCGHL